jgi:hypothetical protein
MFIPDPGVKKTPDPGSVSATRILYQFLYHVKQLCIVSITGFFLQFGHSVVVAAVRCGFGYHLENLVKKVPLHFYYGTFRNLYNLNKSAFVNSKLTEVLGFRQNYLCYFHLCCSRSVETKPVSCIVYIRYTLLFQQCNIWES